MNHITAKMILRKALLLSMLVGVVPTIASAESAKSRENRIVGVWDVLVTVNDCNSGTPLGSFRALHKYELGGTGQVVPATNPALLSPHVAVWKLAENGFYQMAFKMFRFDLTGHNIGWIVVKNDVEITEDGNGYAGMGRAETFDSSGNRLGTSCPTFIGTRFETDSDNDH